MKNPLGLNQTEVVASLALDLVKSSKKVINPITKQPFRVKFGRNRFSSCLISFVFFIINRFSFWSSCWWNSRCKKFSILFIW